MRKLPAFADPSPSGFRPRAGPAVGIDLDRAPASAAASMRTRISLGEAGAVVELQGGAGNDNIHVDPRVKLGITIQGQGGDDRITGRDGISIRRAATGHAHSATAG